MITIKASPMQAIRLGRVGENERLRVAFDVSALLAELPGASFTVINQGPGDAVAYPCPGVTIQRKSFVAFPDMTPPEPETEPEETEE